MENNWLRTYTVLPAVIRHNPELTPIEKLIYSEILGLMNYQQTVFITKEVKTDIAGLYGIQLGAVTKAVNKYVKLQYLKPIEVKDYYLVGVK